MLQENRVSPRVQPTAPSRSAFPRSGPTTNPELEANIVARLRGTVSMVPDSASQDWYGFILGAMTALVAFVVMTRYTGISPAQRFASMPLTVPAAIAPRVAAIEIALPEGLSFHAPKATALHGRGDLRLPVQPGRAHYSAVLKGLGREPRQITVRYLSSEGQPLETRTLTVATALTSGSVAAAGLPQAADSVERLTNATRDDQSAFDVWISTGGGR